MSTPTSTLPVLTGPTFQNQTLVEITSLRQRTVTVRRPEWRGPSTARTILRLDINIFYFKGYFKGHSYFKFIMLRCAGI